MIEAVLFDMGGVLVQLDALDHVLGPTSLEPDEMWRRWILSSAVQSFERGACSVESFAAVLVEELELEGTAAAFIDRFRNFPRGLYPGAAEMVASLPSHVTTGVLSNTSALHWDHQIDADVIRGLCHRAYLSFELGLVKPHREIFEYVLADLGLRGDHVLFIDDNQINVDGARSVGLCAALAKGPEAATSALRDFGLVA